MDFPLNSFLSTEDRALVARSLRVSEVRAGTVLFDATTCKGVLVVMEGVVRVYSVSDSGREITLYRLFKGDLCTLSISCLMGAMPMQAMIKADTDCRIGSLSNDVFAGIHARYPAIQNHLIATMNARMSDMMWVVEQIAFKGIDRRLGEYLLTRPSPIIYSTHDQIAAEIGSAREVVSRMLKYFEKNGYVELSRGKIKVIDRDGLARSVDYVP